MKIRERIGILLLFATLLCTAGKAFSNVAFYHYGIENGLPESRINSISQDSTGFIWLAGENRVYRFNGHQFQEYQHATIQSSLVPFSRINTLFTDSQGTLWVGSNNGVSYFSFSQNRFVHLGNAWKTKRVIDITEDDKGNLWMASETGLLKYTPSTQKYVWFTSANLEKENHVSIAIPTDYITRVTSQPGGIIWLVTEPAGIYSFNPENGKVEKFETGAETSLTQFFISKITYIKDKLVFGTLTHGLYVCNPAEKTIRSETIGKIANTITHFHAVNDSVLWLATNNGLINYNLQNGAYSVYTSDSNNPLSLNRTTIHHVYSDKENNLWVSTGIRGVDYGLTGVPFSKFHISENGGPYYLTYKEVTAIQFDKTGNMWLGYETGHLEQHTYDPLNKIQYNIQTKNPEIPHGSVFALFEDSRQQVWAGGWLTGLLKLNSQTHTFVPVPIKSDSISRLTEAADVRAIIEDKKGNIWISFHGIGLGKYNPATQEMQIFGESAENPSTGLSNKYIYSLCFDKNENLWIASAHGISKMDTETNTFTSWFSEEDNPNSLNSSRVNTVHHDNSGNIWAGTDKGLHLFLPAIGNFKPVLTEEDYPGMNISAIQSVNPGEIWLSTQTGIFKVTYSINSGGKEVVVSATQFNRSDGLLSANYFPRSAGNANGLIYFAGNEGIDFFNPDELSSYSQTSNNIRITEIISDGKQVMSKVKNNEKGRLELDYRNQFLLIRFSAFNFKITDIGRYRYKLEGLNDEWIYLQNEHQATFTHLRPGDYVFRIETMYKGKWINNHAVLPVFVKKPYYMTAGFFIILAVSLFFFVWGISRARSKVLLLRQKKLEQIIEKRTLELQHKNKELLQANQTKDKFFSIISHDLRSPFSGLLGILDLLTSNENSFDSATQDQLLQTVKSSAYNTFELLENLLLWSRAQMKNTTCTIEKHNISEVLRKNINLKKETARQKGISISESFTDRIEALFDKEMINTVIRNILSNAIKFTHPGGQVNIVAENKNGEVKISISDTGIGLTEKELHTIFKLEKMNRPGTEGEKGTGLGLIIAKEFMEKNNGNIWATKNSPAGTVFHLTLPTAPN